MKIKKGWYALFTAPLMIMFCIIVIIPFFTGMGYSLVSWDGLAKSEKVFVGLSNYAKIFSDKQFLTSLVRTTLFLVNYRSNCQCTGTGICSIGNNQT